MGKAKPQTTAYALVLVGQTIHQVPFTGRDQEGLLCYCHEGDKEWTRVAHVKLHLVNHPHPNAPHFGDKEY